VRELRPEGPVASTVEPTIWEIRERVGDLASTITELNSPWLALRSGADSDRGPVG
jgi:hypothetical protein